MTTKITFEYDKPLIHKNTIEPYEVPFYCKELSYEVLQKIFEHYHVIQYQTLRINLSDPLILPAIKPATRGTYIEGIKIEEVANNETSNSIQNFNLQIPHKKISNYASIVNSLIEKYFIKTQITDYGFMLPGSGPLDMHVRPSSIAMGKQEVENYFSIRHIKKNPIKERQLEELIEYGKVAIEEKFNMFIVENIANQIARSIPKEFDPQSGSYNIQHFSHR